MKTGSNGRKVEELQEALLRLGYSLPKWGADGFLGDETHVAAKAFAKNKGLNFVWNQKIPDNVVVTLFQESVKLLQREHPTLIDLRSQQNDPPDVTKRKKKHKIVKSTNKVFRRKMSDIDGIVLHQTAAWFGLSPQQIKRAGGDRHHALHRRGLDVACHAIVFGGSTAKLNKVCGHVIATNPFSWHIWHGNGFNKHSLGLEIEGRYKGLLKHGDPVPDHIIQAAKEGLRFLVEEGRRLGAPIKYIWAHRQSSPLRRSDPGEDIWKKVALDYGVKVLKLIPQPERVEGRGKPVPVEWDSENGVGRF